MADVDVFFAGFASEEDLASPFPQDQHKMRNRLDSVDANALPGAMFHRSDTEFDEWNNSLDLDAPVPNSTLTNEAFVSFASQPTPFGSSTSFTNDDLRTMPSFDNFSNTTNASNQTINNNNLTLHNTSSLTNNPSFNSTIGFDNAAALNATQFENQISDMLDSIDSVDTALTSPRNNNGAAESNLTLNRSLSLSNAGLSFDVEPPADLMANTRLDLPNTETLSASSPHLVTPTHVKVEQAVKPEDPNVAPVESVAGGDFRCTATAKCSGVFASQEQLAAHVRTYHSLEATEAREKALRTQLQGVEQNHAVLREYSNLLRKLLNSAQVKISAAVNPFNVLGGRPKRLFRSSRSDNSQSARRSCAAPRGRSGRGRGSGTRGGRTRRRGRGTGRGSGSVGLYNTDQRHMASDEPEQPEQSEQAVLDSEHGGLALHPASLDGFELEGYDDMEADWFSEDPRAKAKGSRKRGPKKDKVSAAKRSSPFYAVANAESSW